MPNYKDLTKTHIKESCQLLKLSDDFTNSVFKFCNKFLDENPNIDHVPSHVSSAMIKIVADDKGVVLQPDFASTVNISKITLKNIIDYLENLKIDRKRIQCKGSPQIRRSVN